MKIILFLTALLNSVFAFSQCTITGANQLQVGERQVYTATNSEADCESCYQWTYLDQKILLESDTKKKDLTVKATVPGNAILSLEIMVNGEKSKCEKLIKVIAPTSNILSNDNVKCDFGFDSFKEIRSAENKVVFEPQTTQTNFSYNWTITYRNGDTKKSFEKKPEFDYSDNLAIDKVEMQVIFNQCSTKITKNYDTNFWYFF
jgi:hypothetical protein